MLFLSGATIPYELFPSGLQKVAGVLPLTQGIKLMKAVSMGVELENVWKIVVLLLGITLICTAISVKTFRWEQSGIGGKCDKNEWLTGSTIVNEEKEEQKKGYEYDE